MGGDTILQLGGDEVDAGFLGWNTECGTCVPVVITWLEIVGALADFFTEEFFLATADEFIGEVVPTELLRPIKFGGVAL